jgi:hypothetical protein
MILDVVGRVAMRDLPGERALVHVERRDASVGGLMSGSPCTVMFPPPSPPPPPRPPAGQGRPASVMVGARAASAAAPCPAASSP